MTLKYSENYDPNALREEHFLFHFDIVDKDVFTEEEKARIEEMSHGAYIDKLQPGDTFSFTYDVYISYFGRVARNLETMLLIMDKCKNFQVKTEELYHGQCLIQECLCRIEELERKYIDFGQYREER